MTSPLTTFISRRGLATESPLNFRMSQMTPEASSLFDNALRRRFSLFYVPKTGNSDFNSSIKQKEYLSITT